MSTRRYTYGIPYIWQFLGSLAASVLLAVTWYTLLPGSFPALLLHPIELSVGVLFYLGVSSYAWLLDFRLSKTTIEINASTLSQNFPNGEKISLLLKEITAIREIGHYPWGFVFSVEAEKGSIQFSSQLKDFIHLREYIIHNATKYSKATTKLPHKFYHARPGFLKTNVTGFFNTILSGFVFYFLGCYFTANSLYLKQMMLLGLLFPQVWVFLRPYFHKGDFALEVTREGIRTPFGFFPRGSIQNVWFAEGIPDKSGRITTTCLRITTSERLLPLEYTDIDSGLHTVYLAVSALGVKKGE